MKRILDVSVALVLMVILAPVLLVVSILIACSMGRPILFRQCRPGLHGQVFTLLKFRTMTEAVFATYRDVVGGIGRQ